MPRRSTCRARKPRESCSGFDIKPGRAQLGSNPRGNDNEGRRGDREGCFTRPGTWRQRVTAATGLLRQVKKAPAIGVMVVES